MSIKDLQLDYYFDKEGNKVIGDLNCFSYQLFFMLRNNYGFKHPRILFLENFIPQIKVHNGKITDIKYDFSYSKKWEDDCFTLDTKKSDWEHIFDDIEKCLTNNRYVLIRTFTERLPFYYDFAGEKADVSLCDPSHFVLVVHMDDEFLYYVEAPEVLNIKNHIEYNKNVGKIRKENLWNSFSVYIDYSTIDVNVDKIKKPFRINDYFEYLIRIYEHAGEQPNEDGYYSSFGAYAVFMELCESSSLALNDVTNDGRMSLYQLLLTRLHNPFSKKDLLISALSEYKHLFNTGSFNQFSGLLQENRELWVSLYVSIVRQNNTKADILDKKIAQKMDKVAISEREFLEGIKSFNEINSDVLINIE